MRIKPRSVTREFIVAGIAIVVAVAPGVDGIGKPLRLVEVVTLVALGVAAGVSLARALSLARERGAHSTGCPVRHLGPGHGPPPHAGRPGPAVEARSVRQHGLDDVESR
jgi:hypothetical protein